MTPAGDATGDSAMLSGNGNATDPRPCTGHLKLFRPEGAACDHCGVAGVELYLSKFLAGPRLGHHCDGCFDLILAELRNLPPRRAGS